MGRKNEYSSKDSSIAFILALIVPQILVLMIYAFFAKQIEADTSKKIITYISMFVPQISFLLTYIYVNAKNKVNFVKGSKINFKINPLILLLALVIGVVSMYSFTPFVNWFDAVLRSANYNSSMASMIDLSTVGKLIFAEVFIALLPAICEELVFRGIVLNGYKQKSVVFAIIISAVMFGLMHQSLEQFFYQIFLGAVLAFIVYKTGSIVYSMCLHFFNNFIVLLITYLNPTTAETQKTFAELYPTAWDSILPFVILIIGVGIVIGLMFLFNYLVNVFNKKKTLKGQKALAEKPAIATDTETILVDKDKSLAQNSNQNVILPVGKDYNVWRDGYFVCALAVGVLMWLLTVCYSLF